MSRTAPTENEDARAAPAGTGSAPGAATRELHVTARRRYDLERGAAGDVRLVPARRRPARRKGVEEPRAGVHVHCGGHRRVRRRYQRRAVVHQRVKRGVSVKRRRCAARVCNWVRKAGWPRQPGRRGSDRPGPAPHAPGGSGQRRHRPGRARKGTSCTGCAGGMSARRWWMGGSPAGNRRRCAQVSATWRAGGKPRSLRARRALSRSFVTSAVATSAPASAC